jgi:hypothetical protein
MEMESFDLDAYAAAYYYYSQPPYVILAVGLVASILSGLAFQSVLKELIAEWQRNRSNTYLTEMRGWRLLTPFLGMAGGSILFLASGVAIFGIPTKFAYGASLVLTLLVGRLVWWQLGKVLTQLEQGGSAALDLDR